MNNVMTNDIERMKQLVTELRGLINGFDFEKHPAKGNVGTIHDADYALDLVELHVLVLVP